MKTIDRADAGASRGAERERMKRAAEQALAFGRCSSACLVALVYVQRALREQLPVTPEEFDILEQSAERLLRAIRMLNLEDPDAD